MMFTLFLCMFGVLMVFVQLQHELRTSLIANDIAITAQIKVIQDDLIVIREQDNKITGLQVDIIDLREILLVLQKSNSTLRDKLESVENKYKSVCKDFVIVQESNILLQKDFVDVSNKYNSVYKDLVIAQETITHLKMELANVETN